MIFEGIGEVLGEMRLGGMVPAVISHTLPVKFKILETLAVEDHITIFTKLDPSDDGDLLWVEPDLIILDEYEYRLLYKPSHRRNWCTFTIAYESSDDS